MNSLYASLVDFWPLHEATGDADGMCGNNLTDTGGVTQNPGIIDYARQFTNASNQRLSIASNANVGHGDIDFSIAAWAYFDNFTTSQGIVTKDDTAAQRDYNLRYLVAATDRFAFQVFKAGDTAVTVNADTLGSPSTATWYFIVGQHDATNDLITIEVNMGGVDSQATGGALQAVQTAAFVIGGQNAAGSYMDGRVCEVGMWKRMLTRQEQHWLYNNGRGRSWPFDGRPNMARQGRNPLTAGPRRSRSSGVVSI